MWQFRKGDNAQIVRQPGEGEAAPLREAASVARLLFEDSAKRVSMEEWQPGAAVTVSNDRGLEFLVLTGGFTFEGKELAAQSWAGCLPGRR